MEERCVLVGVHKLHLLGFAERPQSFRTLPIDTRLAFQHLNGKPFRLKRFADRAEFI